MSKKIVERGKISKKYRKEEMWKNIFRKEKMSKLQINEIVMSPVNGDSKHK